MVTLAPSKGITLIDTDGDGFSDDVENQLGTDPTDPTSFFKISSVTVAPGRASVTLTWPSVPGLTYQLETSTDLTAEIWETVTTVTGTEGTSLMNGVHFPPADSRTRFYRVRLEQ